MQEIQVLLFWNFLEFFSNIFYLQLFESLDVEAANMEGQL